MSAAERASADSYAGPHHSFPLYSSGAHLRAAWMLAGHAADPAATRRRILAFARAHGLTDRLPKSAQSGAEAKAAAAVAKASRGTARDLLAMVYAHEAGEGDEPQQHRLIDFARAHGIADALPEGAHRFMHDNALPHDHGDADLYHTHDVEDGGQPGTVTSGLPSTAQKAKKAQSAATESGGGVMAGSTPEPTGEHTRAVLEDAWQQDGYGDEARSRIIEFARAHGIMRHLPEEAHGFMHAHGTPHQHGGEPALGLEHTHTVKKAVNVVGKSVAIEKAWAGEDGEAHIEGWVSTNHPDSEKDVVEPEAFRRALDGYAQRRMPLSSEHAMKSLPIGHGQRVALVRDGQVFKEATHPQDGAEFEHFPANGTGVYGRFVINDPQHATQVLKGNVGGFSWVGNLREYEPLPGGGRRFVADSIDPWLESTVAAYPVNGNAVLLAAKAYEAQLAPLAEEHNVTVEQTLEQLLTSAHEAAQREQQEAPTPVETISKADLEALLAGLESRVLAAVDAKVSETVSKAVSTSREGVGRRGVGPAAEDEREADPAVYAIKKAHAAVEKGEVLSDEDKELIAGLTVSILSQGMLAE